MPTNQFYTVQFALLALGGAFLALPPHNFYFISFFTCVTLNLMGGISYIISSFMSRTADTRLLAIAFTAFNFAYMNILVLLVRGATNAQ